MWLATNLERRYFRRAANCRTESRGNDTVAGSRFVERIMSVATMLNMQVRPFSDLLIDAGEAHIRDSGPPSLCPTTRT